MNSAALLTALNSCGIFVEDPRNLDINTVVEDVRTCTACAKSYSVQAKAWLILASRSEIGRVELENIATMHPDVRLHLLQNVCPRCAS